MIDNTNELQRLINQSVFNNKKLNFANPKQFFISKTIIIPKGFIGDFNGSSIFRIPTSRPFDMLKNSDLKGGRIEIKNLNVFGNGKSSELLRKNKNHRFCGMFFANGEVVLEGVQIEDTVNAEIQPNSYTAGLLLLNNTYCFIKSCKFNNHNGTGLLCIKGVVNIQNVQAFNNIGSGISTFKLLEGNFSNITTNGSGMSGISLNGSKIVANYLYAVKAKKGYAGINIGHDNFLDNRSNNAILNNLQAYNCDSWGIFINSSINVSGSSWISGSNGENNLKLVNSSIRVSKYKGDSCLGNDTLIISGKRSWIDAIITDAKLSGIVLSNGATLDLGPNSILSNNGKIDSVVAGINVGAGCNVNLSGRILYNGNYGVLVNENGSVKLGNSEIKGNRRGDINKVVNKRILKY